MDPLLLLVFGAILGFIACYLLVVQPIRLLNGFLQERLEETHERYLELIKAFQV